MAGSATTYVRKVVSLESQLVDAEDYNFENESNLGLCRQKEVSFPDLRSPLFSLLEAGGSRLRYPLLASHTWLSDLDCQCASCIVGNVGTSFWQGKILIRCYTSVLFKILFTDSLKWSLDLLCSCLCWWLCMCIAFSIFLLHFFDVISCTQKASESAYVNASSL